MSDYRYGRFVWRECMTPDVAAAQAFYTAIFHWGTASAPMGESGALYHMHTLCDRNQGGYVPMGAEAGHPPHWMPYVSVESVAATVEKAQAAGGTIAVPPMDIGPGIFAVIGDPQGGYITAWHSKDGDGPAASEMGHGLFCWDQINSTDPAGTVAFYTKVFDWGTMDFHGMTCFTAQGAPVGHVMPAPPGAPTHWLSSVVITNLEETMAEVERLGGKVLFQGEQIPTVGLVGAFADPQGAVIAVLQPEAPSHRFGQFVWHEIMTSDVAAAQAFYTEVFKWHHMSVPMPGDQGGDYHMHGVNGRMQGGTMPNSMGCEPGEAPPPPHWMPYVSVPDVAATVEKVKAAGGDVVVGPMDIEIGVFAVLRDPQGGHLTAWHSRTGDGPLPERGVHGNFCWDQLNTTDVADAVRFYTEVFGWTTTEFAGMTCFMAGEVAVGHVAPGMPGMPVHWLSSVVITKLADTLEAVKAQGGTVALEGLPIPGVGLVGAFADPQGAFIAVLEPEAPAEA